MMNERILELAEQAGMTQMNRRSDGRYVIDEDAFEKFAELIVRECLAIAREEEGQSPFEGPVESKIKQHFGVEE